MCLIPFSFNSIFTLKQNINKIQFNKFKLKTGKISQTIQGAVLI